MIKFKTPLTVIAGPNGSGKTTVCQALATAGRLVSESPQIVMDEVSQGDWDFIKNKWEKTNNPYFVTYVTGIGGPLYWGIRLNKNTVWDILNEDIRLYPETSSEFIDLLIRKGHNIEAKLYNSETGERKSVKEVKKLPSYLSTIVEETKEQYPEMWTLKENIKIKYIPFLDPVRLRQKTNKPVLGDTGQNFGYFLANFKREHPAKFKEIVTGMKEYFPWLVDVMTKGTKFGWTEIQVKVKPDDDEENVIFRSWQINDGLLRLLALATIPHAEPDLKMLVFEEPENGIHPKLIGATVDMLRSFKNIQVVLTTHSPVLLNYLKPEEVVVLVKQGKSGPVAVPFTELDKVEERLKYFDVGDILFHENEWELAKPYLKKLKEQNEKAKLKK